MKNRWREQEARLFLDRYASFGEDLSLRTYTARLIGKDPALVLHGGGNTSVKTSMTTVAGEIVSVLCVKGSGWDLETIEPAGHPAVRMDALLALRKLKSLSDEDMMNAFRCNMLESTGPNPSVETLLHAFLPHKFIDHTHADAILALADQPGGTKRLSDWGQGRLAVVPYIMPGFRLASLAAKIYEANPLVEGLILYKHGIFTFGKSARESYDRMIHWVDAAERTLRKTKPLYFKALPIIKKETKPTGGEVAQILRGVCVLPSQPTWPLGKALMVRHRVSPKILQFVNSREAKKLSQVGPATPDHVIRTKPKPLYFDPLHLENDNVLKKRCRQELNLFKSRYERYVSTQLKSKKIKKIPLDSLPRVVIVPGYGLFALGEDAKAADIALDIYEHTIQIIENATRVGRYEALSDSDLFDMEYWSLEQAKLGKSSEKPLARKIVWISGAASGIGFASAALFGRLGAHVFLTDVNGKKLADALASLSLKNQAASFVCDATNFSQVDASFERCSQLFGGVDVVISNAGYAPTSFMKNCDDQLLRQSFDVNFFAHQNVARAAAQVFQRQGLGGCLLFNASKSTFNPGAEFGPYTLPKTAVIGLMKQYAVELGGMGVRSNAVNADRVRTNLYAGGLVEKRAKARNITVDDYFSNNLLHREVTPRDVAEAFVFLAQAQQTTGATIPVDGGNAAAFPR